MYVKLPFWGHAAAAWGSPPAGWLCRLVWTGSFCRGKTRQDDTEAGLYSVAAWVFIHAFVCETYCASIAAPSASTTRLVSSLEICRASARCMSVMVQKDATRWSRDKTGDVTGHNLPLATKTGNVFQQRFSWSQHATKTEQKKHTRMHTFLRGWRDSFLLCMYEWFCFKALLQSTIMDTSRLSSHTERSVARQ